MARCIIAAHVVLVFLCISHQVCCFLDQGLGYSKIERAQMSCQNNADCADGNECTSHYCAEGGYCVYSPLTCDDGNMCTTADCDSTLGCLFNSVNCSVGAACAQSTCDVHTGCIVDYSACANRGTHDCCMENALPFCGNDTITTCVCLLDSACCTNAWTSECVTLAEASCALPCDPPAEEPANDFCASSMPLTVTGEVSTVFSSVTAETPVVALTSCFGQFTSKGLWFTFTGTGNEIVFDTCDQLTTFETTIHVFTGTCDTLSCVTFANSGEDCAAQLSFQSVNNQSYYLFIGSNTNNPEETIGSFELRYYDSSCRTDADCVDESDMCDTAQCLVGRCMYQEVVCPPATGTCNMSACDPYSGCVYSVDPECTPYKIDCCEHNLYSAGCNNSRVEQCVCAVDARCCNEAWFSICIEIASTNCQAPCFATDTPITTPTNVPATTDVPIGSVPTASPSADVTQTPNEDRSQGVVIALSILVAVFGLLAIIGLIVIIVQRRALGRRYQNADPLLMNYN
jgi:hypothetical protein